MPAASLIRGPDGNYRVIPHTYVDPLLNSNGFVGAYPRNITPFSVLGGAGGDYDPVNSTIQYRDGTVILSDGSRIPGGGSSYYDEPMALPGTTGYDELYPQPQTYIGEGFDRLYGAGQLGFSGEPTPIPGNNQYSPIDYQPGAGLGTGSSSPYDYNPPYGGGGSYFSPDPIASLPFYSDASLYDSPYGIGSYPQYYTSSFSPDPIASLPFYSDASVYSQDPYGLGSYPSYSDPFAGGGGYSPLPVDMTGGFGEGGSGISIEPGILPGTGDVAGSPGSPGDYAPADPFAPPEGFGDLVAPPDMEGVAPEGFGDLVAPPGMPSVPSGGGGGGGAAAPMPTSTSYPSYQPGLYQDTTTGQFYNVTTDPNTGGSIITPTAPPPGFSTGGSQSFYGPSYPVQYGGAGLGGGGFGGYGGLYGSGAPVTGHVGSGPGVMHGGFDPTAVGDPFTGTGGESVEGTGAGGIYGYRYGGFGFAPPKPIKNPNFNFAAHPMAIQLGGPALGLGTDTGTQAYGSVAPSKRGTVGGGFQPR